MAIVLFAGKDLDGIWLLAVLDVVIFLMLVFEGRRLESPRDTSPAAS